MFRVTPQLFTSQTIRYAQQHQARLARLQRQISSGLRIEKPSDDPAAVGTLLAAQAKDLRFDVDVANIEAARSKLNLSVSQLQTALAHLVEAKDVALARDDQAREVQAQQIRVALDNLIRIANTSSDGQFLYGGTASDSPPFTIAERNASGTPAQVTYDGSEDRASVNVTPQLAVDTLYAGSQTFQPAQPGGTRIISTTGAATGIGTDNATGQAELTVRHTTTSYAPGSGIQAGSRSADGDTIIGPLGQHTLTIIDTSGDGTQGTISLNNGPEVTFTSGDTDLRVVGASRGVVHVDTTNIAAGFNGDVQIEALGVLSIDGGATELSIDFTNNQAVTDTNTGAVTYIDSSNITRAGIDYVEHQGTADVFQVLIALRDDLLNTRDLSPLELEEAIGRRIGDLDRVFENINSTLGEQSVALESLDAIQHRTEQLQLEARLRIDEVEAADIPEAVLKLRTEENLLQYTYASSVNLLSLSILDFIR